MTGMTPKNGETPGARRPFHLACTGNGQPQQPQQPQQQQMSQIEEDLLRRQQQQAQGWDL